MNKTYAKILYGSAFCVVLPVLMAFWSTRLDDLITLTIPFPKWFWIVVATIGFTIMTAAMALLLLRGRGLPMNAFPPKFYVKSGLYAFFNHPVYLGACVFAFGVFGSLNSCGGFWLVSPMLSLGCIALVYGYEDMQIREHFKLTRNHTVFGSISSEEKPGFNDIAAIYLKVLLPWLILYEIKASIPQTKMEISTWFNFEYTLPVWEFAEWLYVLVYPAVLLLPLAGKTKKCLSEFKNTATVAVLLGMFVMYLFPFVAPFRSFNAGTVAGDLLLFERNNDSPMASFPSFHVIWVLLAAGFYLKNYPQLNRIIKTLALLAVLSCWLTGMHSIADILTGVLVYLTATYRKALSNRLNLFCERIANSWKEWHMGPLRIINHSIWAGFATFAGMVVVISLIHHHWLVLLICVSTFAGAALWGQFVEGSDKLLRPFGYYGSILGGFVAVVFVCIKANISVVLLLGALAAAAPWVQALGRIRCLVQGCCHGSVCQTDQIGIVYRNQKSRVLTVSGLGFKKLYNTQLFSIICNLLCGLILLRMICTKTDTRIVSGLYLMLNGFSRFVEEAYRGESQTKKAGGLRIYQWFALGSVLFGIAAMCIPGAKQVLDFKELTISDYCVTLIASLVGAFAMGMDFPRSNVRFSRLTANP